MFGWIAFKVSSISAMLSGGCQSPFVSHLPNPFMTKRIRDNLTLCKMAKNTVKIFEWLDVVYEICFRFPLILCDFLAMKCFKIPISLSKLILIFPNVTRLMQL